MKLIYVVWVVLIMMLTLCACEKTPVLQSPEDSLSVNEEESIDAAADDSIFVEEPEDDTILEESEEAIDGMQQTGPQAGYYVVSSVGNDGDVTFYDSIDPANGYLLLNDDNTGTMLFDGVEDTLTWDDNAIYWQDQMMPCVTIRYYDPGLGRNDEMVMVYFLDKPISICLRPVTE